MFTLIQTNRGESLKGVDRSRIHRMRSTLLCKECGESSEGVDPSRIYCMIFTLVYRGCGEYLEGVVWCYLSNVACCETFP